MHGGQNWSQRFWSCKTKTGKLPRKLLPILWYLIFALLFGIDIEQGCYVGSNHNIILYSIVCYTRVNYTYTRLKRYKFIIESRRIQEIFYEKLNCN